jgi:hypothetical protein
MKTYIDHNNVIFFNDSWIPKNPTNRHYQQFLEEQEKGEAKLVPNVPSALTWEEIRSQRNYLLTQSDWTVLVDASPKPNKESWLTYRQALRDITTTYSKPEDVIWPVEPK